MCTHTHEFLWCSSDLRGKPYWPLSGESCYRHEILFQRPETAIWNGFSRVLSYSSGAFIVIRERQRPEQCRPVCSAVSAHRVPTVIIQIQPDSRALISSFIHMTWGEQSDQGLMSGRKNGWFWEVKTFGDEEKVRYMQEWGGEGGGSWEKETQKGCVSRE